jgi:hypothetical protein
MLKFLAAAWLPDQSVPFGNEFLLFRDLSLDGLYRPLPLRRAAGSRDNKMTMIPFPIPAQHVDPTLPSWVLISILVAYGIGIALVIGAGICLALGKNPIDWFI